jgi:ParB family chromosome partitioning protein
MPENRNFQNINVDQLIPFANHPFKPYEGQRLLDMVESVRANGIITPIVARPAADGKFEILSGHNRVAAAREAGLETVPAIVREGLTNEEALFVVTETNLIQRSFADMLHSERATVLAAHYNAIKKKSGYRSDLLVEMEALTYSPLANRSSMGKLGEQYGLSKDTIARYLRIDSLVTGLKERLDNGEIALRVAVTLSYLRKKEQDIVAGLLDGGTKISIKQSNLLRDLSEKGELNKSTIKQIFEQGFFPAKVKPVKFSGKFLSEFFSEDESVEKIESIVAEALRAYLNK